MAKNYDATNLLERLEMFEERLGITLEALSANVQTYDYSSGVSVTIMGELHPRNGVELDSDIRLQAAVYDAKGRMISNSSEDFSKDEFFGLAVFEITALYENEKIEPARIRLFPQKG